MATTFTSNYQIKLIGTGLEAATWGTSNNENFKRVEQALGGSSLAFNIAVPGAPSTYSSHVLTWIVGNNIDAAEAGSDGRNKFVVFKDSGSDLAADQTVNIRGDTAASLTDRIYFVKNSLSGSRKITFNAGGTGGELYVLENGCSAVIYSNSSATEVGNLLDTLQLAGLNFPAASEIDISSPGSGTTNNALRIKSPAQTYFNIKSAADVADSLVTLRAGETRIESATLETGTGLADSIVTSSGNHNLTLQTGNSSTGSITIVDNANEDILLKNHGTGKVVVGSGSDNATISSSGAHNLRLETNDGGTTGTIVITDGEAGAITITPDAGGAGGSVVMSKVDIAGGEIDGTVIGANSAAAITGSTVTSGSSATGVFSSDGNYDVQLKTGNSTTGSITITDGAHGNIALTPDGTGEVTVATDLAILTADGYLNFNITVGSDGIGVRNNSGSVEVKLTSSDAWGIPYHSENVSGQGVYVETAEQTVADTNTASIEHLLGAAPRILTGVLRCTDAGGDLGYVQNDEVVVVSETDGTNERGIALWSNATHLKYMAGANIRLINLLDPGDFANITQSKWRLVIRAWK